MALLNDIKKLQAEGRTEQEIIAELRKQGVTPREIIEALSQSKIKEAVAGEAPSPTPEQYAAPSQQPQQVQQEPMPGAEYSPSQPQAPVEQQTQYQEYQPQTQPVQEAAYPEYQYQPQAAAISSDTITEIAEQVVSEKLSPIRKDMEIIIDLETTMGTKLSLLDERIKRIEAIIDRLQLSIMQKVGDYMTNISDIKKELIETQKSFKSLQPKT